MSILTPEQVAAINAAGGGATRNLCRSHESLRALLAASRHRERELREALEHAVYKSHPLSRGCDPCLQIAALLAARPT